MTEEIQPHMVSHSAVRDQFRNRYEPHRQSAAGVAFGLALDAAAELMRAKEKFPRPLSSEHEAIGVLREEYLELEREAFHGSPKRGDDELEYLNQSAEWLERIACECDQVAAMAMRMRLEIVMPTLRQTISKAAEMTASRSQTQSSDTQPEDSDGSYEVFTADGRVVINGSESAAKLAQRILLHAVNVSNLEPQTPSTNDCEYVVVTDSDEILFVRGRKDAAVWARDILLRTLAESDVE